MKNTKILVGDKIDVKTAITYMTSHLESSDVAIWKEILTNGIQKCAKDAENTTIISGDEISSSSESNEENCSKKSSFFMACTMGQLYVVKTFLYRQFNDLFSVFLRAKPIFSKSSLTTKYTLKKLS